MKRKLASFTFALFIACVFIAPTFAQSASSQHVARDSGLVTQYDTYANEKAVSSSCDAPCTITSTSAVARSATWSFTGSVQVGVLVGVDAVVKAEVEAILGFQISVGSTTTYTSTIGIALPVAEGRHDAYMVFRPRIHVSVVYLDTRNETITVTEPYFVGDPDNGVLQGKYYLVYPDNLIQNPGFEQGLQYWGDWHPDGQVSAQKVDNDWPFDGLKKLTHWSATNYSQTTWQELTNVPDGVYYAKIWLRSGGGQNHVQLYVNQYDRNNQGNRLTADVGGQTLGDWNYISLDKIQINSGKISLNIYSQAWGNQWAAFDHVELQRYEQLDGGLV